MRWRSDSSLPFLLSKQFLNEQEINFDIVFVTGYSEYAIQAFKLSAIDYLLKPLNPDQLQQTINKLDRKDGRQKQQEYKALQHNIAYNQDVQDKCIIVNLSNSTRFIKVKDIVYLSAEGSYCNLFLKNQEKLLASKNLKYFEERLTDFPQFFRCHKSYIINLKEVKEYNKSEQTIFLDYKQTALLSADKSDIFMSKMEALN